MSTICSHRRIRRSLAANLTHADVVAAWAGIRPLIASGHNADPASASREHAITREPSGVFTITGGKLTTYRAMAAEVIDAVEAALGRGPAPTRTHLIMLPGADRAAAVDAPAARNPALGQPLSPDLGYRGADLVYGVQSELACTLSDLLMRRTHVAFETRDAGVSLAPRAAAWSRRYSAGMPRPSRPRSPPTTPTPTGSSILIGNYAGASALRSLA